MKLVVAIFLLVGLSQLISGYIPANAVDHEYSSDTDKSSHLQLYGDVRGFQDDSISLQMSGEDTNGTTSGFIVHFTENNATSQPAADSPWLAFISCDSNSTDSTDEYDIFSFAADRGAKAVLLYTTTRERCEINPTFLQTYNRVIDVFATSTKNSARLIDNQFDVNSTYYWFNSQSINDTAGDIQDNPSMRVPYLLATLSAFNATQTPSNPGGGDQGTQQDQDSPNNTSLAMIILYVIIAVVTILFMIVILSGAFRAVRNPQRYGERPARREVMDTVSGQTVVVEDRGQTRAGGIARAILETFPLINFNNEPRMRSKGDAEGEHTPDIEMGESNTNTDDETPDQSPKQPCKESDAAAEAEAEEDSPQNCPICYEDFEQGEQLRLLPCNEKHCFHAKCIDPWLLDIQGVCPLCRQDFRDQTVESNPTSAGGENANASTNSTANVTPTTDSTQFPPLTTAHLAGRRQASMQSLRSVFRVPFRRQRHHADEEHSGQVGESIREGEEADNDGDANNNAVNEVDITDSVDDNTDDNNERTNNDNNENNENNTSTNNTNASNDNNETDQRTTTTSPFFASFFRRQKNNDGSDRV